MVKRIDPLTALFGAVADPTRREILTRLRDRPHSVSELGAPLQITLAAVGKHITTLESAGLIRTAKRGRVRTCTLVPGALADAETWIAEQSRFWTDRMDALDIHLQGDA